jgi:hypothetical protein
MIAAYSGSSVREPPQYTVLTTAAQCKLLPACRGVTALCQSQLGPTERDEIVLHASSPRAPAFPPLSTRRNGDPQRCAMEKTTYRIQSRTLAPASAAHSRRNIIRSLGGVLVHWSTEQLGLAARLRSRRRAAGGEGPATAFAGRCGTRLSDWAEAPEGKYFRLSRTAALPRGNALHGISSRAPGGCWQLLSSSRRRHPAASSRLRLG